MSLRAWPRIRHYGCAAFRQPRHTEPRHTEPRPLGSGIDWTETLEFCDRTQLTLILGDTPRALLPESVRERIAQNVADNIEHLARIRAIEAQIHEWFEAEAIDFLVLKGTTHWPHFVSDLHLRSQCDLDLFCPRRKRAAPGIC